VGKDSAAQYHEHSAPIPAATLVMAIKASKKCNIEAWRPSQHVTLRNSKSQSV
jgi:hypothetical protein